MAISRIRGNLKGGVERLDLKLIIEHQMIRLVQRKEALEGQY